MLQGAPSSGGMQSIRRTHPAQPDPHPVSGGHTLKQQSAFTKSVSNVQQPAARGSKNPKAKENSRCALRTVHLPLSVPPARVHRVAPGVWPPGRTPPVGSLLSLDGSGYSQSLYGSRGEAYGCEKRWGSWAGQGRCCAADGARCQGKSGTRVRIPQRASPKAGNEVNASVGSCGQCV